MLAPFPFAEIADRAVAHAHREGTLMVVSKDIGSMNSFQSLLGSIHRLEQERTELFALRKKVSNSERAIQRKLIGSQNKQDGRRLGLTNFKTP